MVGTPWLSRVTVTGADNPAICSRPSSWGRAESATNHAYVIPPTPIAATASSNHRSKRRTGERRERGVVISANVLMRILIVCQRTRHCGASPGAAENEFHFQDRGWYSGCGPAEAFPRHVAETHR